MREFVVVYDMGGYTVVSASSFAEAEAKGLKNGIILSITLKES